MTDHKPFHVLLNDSLRVREGDELLVVYDETLLPFFDDLVNVVVANHYSCSFVCLPIEFQRHLARQPIESSEIRLPSALWVAMSEVDVVLTILSGDINLAKVRRAIVGNKSGLARPGNRLAHVPGISAEVLEVLTRSPIAQIEEHCELFAWALGEGLEGSLATQDAGGRAHLLTCDLGGWYNEPLMSPGVIYPDSWGNVPPGETFCCPAPRGVNGSVVINGSVPGHVCAPEEEVILDFDSGKLTDWHTTSVPLQSFFTEQKRLAEERRDPQWNTFAELGVGLNPAISRLTGNSLFDEKAYGTVHIAIGDNSGFGHSVQSDIHADLVIRNPNLTIDGHATVDQGRILTAGISEWRDSFRTQSIEPSELRILQMRPETFESVPRWPDAFSRRLHRRGRTGYVKIARQGDARALEQLRDAMTPDDWSYPPRILMISERMGLSKPVLARLLGLLAHYRMIHVSPDPFTRGQHAHV